MVGMKVDDVNLCIYGYAISERTAISIFDSNEVRMDGTYVSRGEHELCVSTAYDGTAKLDGIWRLFCVTY